MKPLLLLLLAGCAFGQVDTTSRTDPYVTCVDKNMRHVPCGAPAPKKPAGQKLTRPSCSIFGEGWVLDIDGVCRNKTIAEAIDVPAIQERRTIKQEPCKSMEIMCGNTFIKREWTCADKTRILEHDEVEPPKYWCRRVQP